MIVSNLFDIIPPNRVASRSKHDRSGHYFLSILPSVRTVTPCRLCRFGLPANMVEALLNDIKLDNSLAESFITRLEDQITGIRPCENCSVADIRMPIITRPRLVKDIEFSFEPPVKLELIGGCALSSSINSGINVDLAVRIPSKCWTKQDFKNYRYHYKRAFYLAYIAKHLCGSLGDDHEYIGTIQFRYFAGDYLKPVLIVRPKSQELKDRIKVQIFAYAAKTSKFKVDKLRTDICNVDPRDFYGK